MSPSDDRRPRRASHPPIRKSLGQHFLNDRRILQRIVDALELTGLDTVVEIGAGRGSLSDLLAPLVKRLVLIEIDRMLAARLRDRFGGVPSISIVEADVLTVDLAAAAGPGGGPFKIVGNVPYNITTPILFHALRAPRPTRAVYLVQREVAERIVAPPDSDAYGALSVNVQAVASPKLLFRVAAGAFTPPPKVESAVVRIDPRDDPVIRDDEEPAFRRFVQDAFGMRRKQLRRVIRAVLGIDVERANAVLDEAGIDGTARPETLAPEAFARLLRVASRDSSARS